MNKVIIGIVGKPDNTDRQFSYIQINNDIKEALNEYNALCIGIIPQDAKYKKSGFNNDKLNKSDIDKLKDIISIVDGVVLQGGLVSNSYEKEIVKICNDTNKPLLGICCGFNNMIEALGGKLYEDTLNIHDKYGEKEVHEVIINKNSKLFGIIGKERIKVNSIHKKIAKRQSIKKYNISAICPLDDSVEAIEMENKKFMIGIKWHPELLQDKQYMNKLFEQFVKSCR